LSLSRRQSVKKMITLGITAALVALSSAAPAVADDDPAAGATGAAYQALDEVLQRPHDWLAVSD
jgi:hypothetical protein